MKSLSIIGCGKVGKVVGRLFHQTGMFEIREILNRSLESGQDAAAFIGAGRAVPDFAELSHADLFLVASSDDAIADCAHKLCATGLVTPGTIVWHLSGALPSTVLAPVTERGGEVASVHPVKSFADPAVSAAGFSGTWCGIEGDGPAVDLLTKAFEAVGGKPFAVDSRFKTVYHAGAVLACNYLTALMECGVRCYEKAGIPRDVALQVMEPLVRGTVDNIFSVGTEQALTGPIARGDAAVVARQLEALENWDPRLALIYRDLGAVALELAKSKAAGGEDGFLSIKELLSK